MSLPGSLARNPALDSWIRIHSEARITIFTGKAELGQGIKTALASIAAEELDVSPHRIFVQPPDTAISPNEFLTAGSMSVEDSGSAVRQAAAEARAILVDLAAEQLGCKREQIRVEDGVLRATGIGSRTTYWELMGGKAFQCDVTGRGTPKDPATYVRVGVPARRIDIDALVTGTARFAQDLSPPGSVHGRVVRPPRYGVRLESLDPDPTRAMAGVIEVVRDGSFVGVVAEREEQAIAAAARLRRACRWSVSPPLPPQNSLFHSLTTRPALSQQIVDGTPREGNVPAIESPREATTTLNARYHRPYHMHASIGPSAAMARQDPSGLVVWTHSQGVPILRVCLAQALGLDPEAVRVVHVEGPGCYGHNGADDAALDAALLARALPGRHVLLKWMREDEHAWEPYGPAMVIELQASLDRDGNVIDWNHDAFSATHMGRPMPLGDKSGLLAAWHRDPPLPAPSPRVERGFHGGIHRNADPLYAFPRRRIVSHLVTDLPLRTSSTRSLGAYANVFGIESFMDELAAASGADPVEFRLRHLRDERAREVLSAATERAGWPPGELGEGRGRGVAFAQYKNQKCYAAVVFDVAVDEDGTIRLERAVVAADAGRIIDPDGLRNQLEGGVIQSASWTLKESVAFDEDGITSTDWESYPILTFPEVPAIETVLIDRPHLPSLGSGEAVQGPVPAAISNAVHNAIGVRLREIPFTPECVRAACAEEA